MFLYGGLIREDLPPNLTVMAPAGVGSYNRSGPVPLFTQPMAIGKFLKRLLTGEEELCMSDNPFPKEEVLVEAAPIKTTLCQETRAAILHRDEIIDDRGRIAGYRFYV